MNARRVAIQRMCWQWAKRIFNRPSGTDSMQRPIFPGSQIDTLKFWDSFHEVAIAVSPWWLSDFAANRSKDFSLGVQRIRREAVDRF